MGIREAIAGFGQLLAADNFAELRETNQQYADSYALLTERLAELELSLEDSGWQRLSGESETEFSRAALRKINSMARLYWLKNPLVRQAVAVQTRYVFGQGVSIQGRHPAVNEVVQAFLADRKNQSELTSHQARMIKETELQLFANVFFVFFPNLSTGRVRVRTIGPDEIDDVICNPEDAKDPWYYRRGWARKAWDATSGQSAHVAETAYYPDWRYNPAGGHPATIGGHPVKADTPVYHVAVNRLSDMRFGVSEVYASLDWAKAYTQFLSDWATIVRAYSRFAWNLQTKGGSAGVAAAKARLGTTLTASSGRETNPPPATASTFIGTEGVSMTPIKTSGATTSAEDGRHIRLMVGAAMGIFDHYFGDPSTGNLATATAMERPMELMFRDRQTLWADVLRDILDYVIDWAAKAPNGPLAQGATVTVDEDGEEVVTLATDDETGEPIDRGIAVTFPPLLEKAVKDTVAAIISAATLDGKTTSTLDLKTVTRMLLSALGEQDVDELITHLFGEDGEGGALAAEREERAARAPAIAPQPTAAAPAPEDQMAQEVRRLAEAAEALANAAA